MQHPYQHHSFNFFFWWIITWESFRVEPKGLNIHCFQPGCPHSPIPMALQPLP